MGAEARCRARFGRTVATGTVRLEADALEFRAEGLRLTIPFRGSRATARAGVLTVKVGGRSASFELGEAAAKWAQKILHPPSRLQKLGVKPDWLASVVGVVDEAFLMELEQAVWKLSRGRLASGSDAIFFGAASERDLTRLKTLKHALKPEGALWIVRPKASSALSVHQREGARPVRHQHRGVAPRAKARKAPHLSERAVMAAGKAAGLVDVKVVSFSPTHTAEKFVIPVADRPRTNRRRSARML
jgi:hypothetical protein